MTIGNLRVGKRIHISKDFKWFYCPLLNPKEHYWFFWWFGHKWFVCLQKNNKGAKTMKTKKIERLKKWLICKLGGEFLYARIAELEKDNKSLESGLELLQQRYEELGVEISKHTAEEYSYDEAIVNAVDYITIPYQRLAIPRKIKG